MIYPRLNHELLFNSDDSIKLRLISELTEYMGNYIRYSNKTTMWNFVKLISLISNPQDRQTWFNAITSPEVNAVIFGSKTGIVRHLKIIAEYKMTGFPLLSRIYLQDSQSAIS